MFTGQADVALETARQLEGMLKPGDATRWAKWIALPVSIAAVRAPAAFSCFLSE